MSVARTPAAIAGTSEQQQQQPPTATRAAVPRPPVVPGHQPRAAAESPSCGCCAETKSSGSLPPAVLPPRRRARGPGRQVGHTRSAAVSCRSPRTPHKRAHKRTLTRHTRARTHVHTHTRPCSLDYSIVDSARAHTDGRQFAVCACSVTVFAVAAALTVRKRTAVPHPNNHCSLSGSILLFVVTCRERARQFGVYNNPSPVVSLSPLS